MQDLVTLGATGVTTSAVDLNKTEGHRALVERAVEHLGGIDIVLIAQGVLGDQAVAERRFEDAADILNTNFVSVVSLLTELTSRALLERGAAIAVIGSVAGDRGRRSNYVYAASKAGLEAYVEGLRARLFEDGITVTLIKPGFVDTPMTAHLEKKPLPATPAQVAQGIARAIRGHKDVVYVPWFWGPIMGVIRALPHMIFKRMKF